MSGPASKAKKKKRTQDEQSIKRLKYPTTSNSSSSTKPVLFENTLSLPIQQALFKFREASEQELIRLRKEGLEPSAAINKLVEKMRTIESNVSPCFSRQELDLVMEMAGINEEGAMRALILRSELAKLRHDGFNHPEAINELARRMKRLAGSKRRISLADGTIIDTKHRRKDVYSTPPAIPSPPISLSRVSFSHLDPADGLGRPLEASINLRKRLQDVLMMDAEGWGQMRKRARFLDKDISDSDGESSAEESSPPIPHHQLYRGIEDLGEFSQDEEKEGGDEGDEGADLLGGSNLDDIPLFSAFSEDYPSDEEKLEDDTQGTSSSSSSSSSHHHPSISSLSHPLQDDFLSTDADDSWTTLTATAAELLALPPAPTSIPTPSFLSPPLSAPPPPSLRAPKKHRDSSSSTLSQRTIS